MTSLAEDVARPRSLRWSCGREVGFGMVAGLRGFAADRGWTGGGCAAVFGRLFAGPDPVPTETTVNAVTMTLSMVMGGDVAAAAGVAC